MDGRLTYFLVVAESFTESESKTESLGYADLIANRPLSSEQLIAKHVWWWREMNSAPAGGTGTSLIHHNFKTIWERSAFIYELVARIEGEYEHGKPWLSLKLRQHSLIHSKWDADPIAKAFESWKGDMREPKLKRVEELSEIYSPKKGWTLPMSFNLNHPTDEILDALRERLETIKARTPVDLDAEKEVNLWRIIELFDKMNLAQVALNDSEQALIDKVVQAYQKSREQMSA